MAKDYFSGLQPAKTTLETAEAEYLPFAQIMPSLKQELEKVMKERFVESPLIQERGRAMKEFLTAVPEKKAELAKLPEEGVILSPSQQQAILAQTEARAISPLSVLNLMLSGQYGGLQDLIRTGTEAFTSAQEAMKAKRDIALGAYNRMLDKLYKETSLGLEERRTAATELSAAKARGLTPSQEAQETRQEEFETNLNEEKKNVEAGTRKKEDAIATLMVDFPEKYTQIEAAFKHITQKEGLNYLQRFWNYMQGK